MKRTSNQLRSKTTRSAWTVAAVVVIALVFGQSLATAGAPADDGRSDDSGGLVARAFNLLSSMKCVTAGLLYKIDQVFIRIHAWDARSQLHDERLYPVCS